MMFNPYLAHEMAKENMKDALREVERARLIEVTNPPGKSRGWRLPTVLIFMRTSRTGEEAR